MGLSTQRDVPGEGTCRLCLFVSAYSLLQISQLLLLRLISLCASCWTQCRTNCPRACLSPTAFPGWVFCFHVLLELCNRAKAGWLMPINCRRQIAPTIAVLIIRYHHVLGKKIRRKTPTENLFSPALCAAVDTQIFPFPAYGADHANLHCPVLHFQGTKGAPGQAGPAGEQGMRGPQVSALPHGAVVSPHHSHFPRESHPQRLLGFGYFWVCCGLAVRPATAFTPAKV